MDFSQNRYKTRSKTHHASGTGMKDLIMGSRDLDSYLNSLKTDNVKNTIYIHIPFCSKICTFCNMRRSLIDPPKDYADLVVEQIKRYSQYDYIQNKDYDSIYFGGGTPTTLDTNSLRKILQGLKNNLSITDGAEISLETTITELDKEKMEMLFEEGVNRFSIGIQTFSNSGRKTLGRIGDSETVIKKINQLLDIGFSNINIDLIYNYPNQSIDEIYKDIKIASSLDIAGFSFYSLILNDKAQLINTIRSPENYYNENLKREMEGFNIITKEAEKNGFEFLELTKMVRPGRDEYKYINIRHNGGDTLPIGAGAGGNIGNMAIMNELNLDKFKKQISDFKNLKGMVFKPKYYDIKKISSKLQFTQINMEEIENQYLKNNVISFFNKLIEEGFAMKKGNIYNLTGKGIFWGNNICRELSEITRESLISSNKIFAIK